MISDERPHIRELAWRKIKRCRSARSKYSPLTRTFVIPKLVRNCTDYSNMIRWQDIDVTEPPMTSDITNNELDTFIENQAVFQFLKYPLHTQAVERNIKLVSEASAKVCGSFKLVLVHVNVYQHLNQNKITLYQHNFQLDINIIPYSFLSYFEICINCKRKCFFIKWICILISNFWNSCI